jgi:hypothetical protein
MSPYDAPDSRKPDKAVEPCEHCGRDDEPVHPVHSGAGILILCSSCRSEVVGGS